MAERWTYDQIRWSVMRTMYDARRTIIKRKRAWLHPIEDVGVAYDYGEEDPVSVSDLYDLMVNTIYLILCAGLSPEPGLNRATKTIRDILSRHSLADLIKDVPDDEARQLRTDLEILGFIPHEITRPLSRES